MRCSSECLKALHLCIGCSRHLDRRDPFFDPEIRLCSDCIRFYRDWLHASDRAGPVAETLERLRPLHPDSEPEKNHNRTCRTCSRWEAFREEIAHAQATGEWDIPAFWLMRQLQLASNDVLSPDALQTWIEIRSSARKGASEGPRLWDLVQKEMKCCVEEVPSEHLKAVEAAVIRLVSELR